jgi:hypothetical protein
MTVWPWSRFLAGLYARDVGGVLGDDMGLGKTVQVLSGLVALSLCRTTAHPLHTRFANIFGTSVSEATMRPNPNVQVLAFLAAVLGKTCTAADRRPPRAAAAVCPQKVRSAQCLKWSIVTRARSHDRTARTRRC